MRLVYFFFMDLLSGDFQLLYILTQFQIDFWQNVLEFLQLIIMGFLDDEIFVIVWVCILFHADFPISRVFVVIFVNELNQFTRWDTSLRVDGLAHNREGFVRILRRGVLIRICLLWFLLLLAIIQYGFGKVHCALHLLRKHEFLFLNITLAPNRRRAVVV